MTDETQQSIKTYEIKLRVLGNEVFAIALGTSDDSNRVLAFGLITVFCVLTVIGAYGERLVNLFKMLTG
jgi:hypothetical protein